MTDNSTETFAFGSEISQLLDLIKTNATVNKETFLKEVIAIARDAMERVRAKYDKEILITCCNTDRKLTIIDTGIGFTRDDLINLGKTAESGTKAFLKALQAKTTTDGLDIGFFSAFLVAEKVSIRTKNKYDDRCYEWESDGGGSFKISTVQGLSCGTTMIFSIKQDQIRFLDKKIVEQIVERNANLFRYQVKVEQEKQID